MVALDSTEKVFDSEPDCDALGVDESDIGPDAEGHCEEDIVKIGVELVQAVASTEPVTRIVAVTRIDPVRAPDPLREIDPVNEGDAEADSDADALTETLSDKPPVAVAGNGDVVAQAVAVVDDVRDAVPHAVSEAEPDNDARAEVERNAVRLGLKLSLGVPLSEVDVLALRLIDDDCSGELEALRVGDLDTDEDIVPDGDLVRESDAVNDVDCVLRPVVLTLAVVDADMLADTVTERERVPVTHAVPDAVVLAVTDVE